jgi:hypothetical protein
MAGRRALTPFKNGCSSRSSGSCQPGTAASSAQWFTGFRISEILSLTVGSALRNGEIVSKVGVAPRNMKGGYGRIRWIPVLHRALFSYLRRIIEARRLITRL